MKSKFDSARAEILSKPVPVQTAHYPMPSATLPVVFMLVVFISVGFVGKESLISPQSVVETQQDISEEQDEAADMAAVKSMLTAAMSKNEAAPVWANSLPDEVTAKYISDLAPVAINEMHKFGIPASISLAQGLIESRAGQSKLAKAANNHFGVKCFSRRCSRGHCVNFTDDTHKDFFRKYESRWMSFRAHSVLLTSGRYASLQKYGRDYKKWAYGLKAKGYATDRTYAEKLIGIIEKYQLNQYDK